MMRIAFVTSTKKWGGVKTWMLDVGAELHALGHRVFVYARQPEFVEQAQARTGHGEAMVFGPDFNPMAIACFMRAFKERRIDAVFVNVQKDMATAGVAANWLGIPVIQRIGLPGDVPRRFTIGMLHRFIRPYFFCPCRYIADGFLRSLPYVNPEMVRVQLTGKLVTGHALVAHRPRRLIVTQQLNADKGHAVLLQALAGLDLPFELHVVGTGTHKAELKALAHELGLDARVVWHGFSTQVNALLAEADIFLLASLREGLPNTLLEALAHGLVPIVRDVGGVREVLTPALEPWIVPPEADAACFRQSIVRALTLSDAALLDLKQAARTACREQCELHAMVRELASWLQSLLCTRQA